MTLEGNDDNSTQAAQTNANSDETPTTLGGNDEISGPAALENSDTSGTQTNEEDNDHRIGQAVPADTPAERTAPDRPPTADSTTAALSTATTAQPEADGDLDDPEATDWEHDSMDFGDEPADENWDVWGCSHNFDNLEKNEIPPFWKVGVDPSKSDPIEVECMSCFKKARVWENVPVWISKPEETGEDAEDGTIIGSAMIDEVMDNARMLVKGGAHAAEAELEERKERNGTKCAFDCSTCGIIYCGPCSRAAVRNLDRGRRRE